MKKSFHPNIRGISLEHMEKMENMEMFSGSPTEMFSGSPTEMFSASPTEMFSGSPTQVLSGSWRTVLQLLLEDF